MKISIIAAIADNNVIGKNNDLIWHISEDLKRFKELTSGNPIIMGRKTYESLPFKPLPNRMNIILSQKKGLKYKGAIVVSNVDVALRICDEDSEIFIGGGAKIYELFLPLAHKMYLTRVFKSFEGDTFFPEFNKLDWNIVKESEIHTDTKSGLNYQFIEYIRKF